MGIVFFVFAVLSPSITETAARPAFLVDGDSPPAPCPGPTIPDLPTGPSGPGN